MYEKKRPPPDEMLPTWLKTYPGHCKIICHETDRQKETRKSKQEILWCGFELLPESGTHRQETLHLWIKLQTTAQCLQCHTNTWLFWLFLHAMARIQLIFLYYVIATSLPHLHTNAILRKQRCSGAGTRRSTVLANILEPKRRSGKYHYR